MKKLCASALLCVWLALPAWSQDLPPAPDQGLRDDTRALPEAIKTELIQDIQAAKRSLHADVWLNAGTFLSSGQTIRSQANELRQFWSGNGDAVLFNYDRASETFGYSYSPSLWQRYPSVELLELAKEGAQIMSDKDQPLETRLAATIRHLIGKMQRLEQERQQRDQVLNAAQKQLGLFFLSGLALAATLIFTVGAFLRRKEVQAAWQKFFPSVQVGTRFGAAHGGGVCAVKE